MNTDIPLAPYREQINYILKHFDFDRWVFVARHFLQGASPAYELSSSEGKRIAKDLLERCVKEDPFGEGCCCTGTAFLKATNRWGLLMLECVVEDLDGEGANRDG